MPVNQRAIADRLNLTVSTVSKSLRNCTDVSEQTRVRVLAAAAEMGYGDARLRRPPRAEPRRRFLPYRRTPVATSTLLPVGLLVHWGSQIRHDVHQPGHEMLMGATDAAGELGVTLSLHFDRDEGRDWTDPAHQPAALRSGQLRGLLLMYNFDAAVVAHLARHYPCVTTNHHHLALGADLVATDTVGACVQSITRLLERGHRRIGLLTIGRSHGGQQTTGAFAAAACNLGLTATQFTIVGGSGEGHRREQLAHKAAEHARRGVTAWITKSNYLVYDLADALTEQGLTLGRDVAAISLGGDTPIRSDLQITTCATVMRDVGAAGITQLLDRIRDPRRAPVARLLYPTLTPGQTDSPRSTT